MKKDDVQHHAAEQTCDVRRHLGACLNAALCEYIEALADTPCRGLHKMTIEAVEGELLTFVLRRCDGNLCEAARMLGISRTTLGKKMRDRGLKRESGENGKSGKSGKINKITQEGDNAN